MPPEQKTDTDSVRLKVEDPVSDTQPPTESPATQNKRGLTCNMPIPKPIRIVLLSLLFICLSPVFYACVTAATLALVPVLLTSFIVVRLLQFVIRGESSKKQFLLKMLLRYWIFVVVMILLIEVGIFYPIAKYVPEIKLFMIIGLPITKWIKIICILIGIYLVSQVVWLSVAAIAYLVVLKSLADFYERRVIVLEAISEIFGCLLFFWAEVVVMNSVLTLKQSKMLGVYTEEWIKVPLFLLIGYNIITLLTHILVWSLPKLYGDHLGVGETLSTVISFACCDDVGKDAFNKKYVVYAALGIKRSIVFILTALMVLLTWVLYFDGRLTNTKKTMRVFEFGTRTLISVLICSFLWLIKSCILLYWEAHTVYDRLHSKIADIGKQLYFLVLLSYDHSIQSPTEDLDNSSGCIFKNPPKRRAFLNRTDTNSEGEVNMTSDRKIVRSELIDLSGPKASTYDIQKAARRFTIAQYTLSKESLSGKLEHLRSNDLEQNDSNVTQILKKTVFSEATEDYAKKDWEILLELLPDVKTPEDITFLKVKTWMERAHSRCRFLCNTLNSEKEVVKCLNQVTSWLIIFATFIMWLLLTGLAKTNVLVLIASPLLAATFIFGDTAKNLFQGLIFVYIVHPFDVGDLCILDDKLLEVKRIGVWCTTFSKVRAVGKKQEVIYPNSGLATKNVINHKTEFDWNDNIQFICSPNKDTTKNLKQQIETYLDAEKEKFTPHFHSVEFLETGDKLKIAVHIQHNIKAEGWTYFECLKEKEKRRFEFALYIQNLVNEQESKTETPELLVEVDQEVTEDD